MLESIFQIKTLKQLEAERHVGLGDIERLFTNVCIPRQEFISSTHSFKNTEVPMEFKTGLKAAVFIYFLFYHTNYFSQYRRVFGMYMGDLTIEAD